MSFEITRGEFLRGTAAGVAGFAALGVLGGCTSESANEDQTAVETLSLDDATYDVDVVVVGSGAAGMSAAVEAAAGGANVLLIEASSRLGGTTMFAEGILGVSTPIQQKLGISNNIPDLVLAELEFSNYAADGRLIQDLLEHSDEDIEWLQSHGVKFYDNVIGGATQHLYVGQGKSLIAALEASATEAGATLLTSTRGKRLFVENGTVTGIVAEGADGEFPIRTKSVILACGGFIQNEEMLSEMFRFSPSRLKITANPNHLGDQITMAYAAGADQSGIVLLHLIWCGLENYDLHSELSTAACNEPYFWLDEKGQRFINETLIFQPSVVCNPVLNQKRAFSILSQPEVDRLMTEGCTVGWGSYIFAGAKLTDLQNQLDAALADPAEGFFYGASIEELATALEMDADVLRESIVNYNALCDAGADTDFYKPAPFMRKVSEDGPFYAFELQCNVFCTMGGIRVNQQNEVLDAEFNAIPGLYCAGVDCSGLQGTTYCIRLGGGAQGYAVYSGRNSARSSISYIGA